MIPNVMLVWSNKIRDEVDINFYMFGTSMMNWVRGESLGGEKLAQP